MPTPNVYYELHEEHQRLRALALRMLMSDEVGNLGKPHASALFDVVGDMTEAEAAEALGEPIETPPGREVFDPTDPTSRMYESEIIE